MNGWMDDCICLFLGEMNVNVLYRLVLIFQLPLFFSLFFTFVGASVLVGARFSEALHQHTQIWRVRAI